MPDTSSPPDGPILVGEEIARSAEALRLAARDLRSVSGRIASVDEVIWSALGAAVTVIDGLPDREKTWLDGGGGGWGMVGLTRSEAEDLEMARLMAGIAPGDPMSSGALTLAIERSLAVMKWLRYCQTPRRHEDFHKSVYWLLAGRPDAAAAVVRRPIKGARDASAFARDSRSVATILIREGLGRETSIRFDNDQFHRT